MKTACIDIGSNSVRLLIPQSGKEVNNKELISSRLAENLAKTGYLNKDAIARTCEAVVFFYEKALKCGCSKVCVFATAAVRNARNGSEFTALLLSKGIEVDVLSGEEEAETGFNGALCGQSSDSIVFDIGGGSTELIRGKNGGIYYKKSVPLGMVVLSDLAGFNKEKIDAAVKKYLADFKDALSFAPAPLYGIGGTATSLAAMALQLREYDAEIIHRQFVNKEKLEEIEHILYIECRAEPEKIAARYPVIGNARASIICQGAIMTKNILDLFGSDGYTALETDNLEGYLLKKSATQK